MPAWLAASNLIELGVIVVGALAFAVVYFLPTVRFVASDDWVKSIGWIAVPLLWSVSLIHVTLKYSNKDRYDAVITARWASSGEAGKPPTLKRENDLSTFLHFCVTVLALRFFSLCILVLWIPMATTLYSSGPVSHDFTVVGIRENSRLPDTVDFEGHYWVVNGLPNPPHSLRELLQPGDTIRLHGTGNRWGVFYTEIELIKQE